MADIPDRIEPGTRGPGYRRAPNHRVAFVPSRNRVTIEAGGVPLAETDDVVLVEESGYPIRRYLARDAVDMSRLEKTDKTSYCPFKGLATYYVIKTDDGEVREAAWSYEQPYHESELLRDRLAFDAERVKEIAG